MDTHTIDRGGSWRRGWAYIIAAIVFHAATVLSMQAILLLRTGKLGDWWPLISSCAVITYITLVIFGTAMVSLGHKILKMVYPKVISEKLRHGLAYVIGYMAILTVFAGLSLMAMELSDSESVLAWWSYGLAYIIIGLCASLAGAIFGHFYTPTRKEA